MPRGDRDEVSVDRESLSAIVQSALGADAKLLGWASSLIYAGYGAATGSLQRVTATIGRGDEPRHIQWSAVLKSLRPESENAQLSSAEYWKREAELYASGLQAELPDGLRAPRVYALVDGPSLLTIWLEDLGQAPSEPWPVSRYGEAARIIGQWNAAYLHGKPLPDRPWLARQGAQQWGELNVSIAANLESERDLPNVQRYWPGRVFDKAVALRADRARLYAVLDRLPQVLGHGDFHQGNLFSRPRAGRDDEFVAVDWAHFGIHPLGSDVARLVTFSCFYHNFDADNLPAIAEASYSGFLRGLRESGWAGDERLARLGFTGSAATMAGLMSHGYRRHSPERIPIIERAWGRPYDDMLDVTARTRAYCLELADEARSLWHLV